MKIVPKIVFFLVMLFLFQGMATVMAHGQYTRNVKREFAVNPDAQLTINNRYGKIHVTTGTQNKVSIEVTITVSATSEEDAEKQFRKISIDFSETPAAVSAITTIDGGPGRGAFAIDYQVQCPITLNLDLTNKFGDIYLNELEGKLRVTLGYGTMEANKLANSDNLIDFKFSKGRLDWIKGAVVIMKYSELNIAYAGSLRLSSKYSSMNAGNIIALNLNFEGGQMNMDRSSAVDSKSKFSDLNIKRLEQSLNLDIQYGSCEIHEMPADFKSVTIRNKYANVNVRLSDRANYTLDASMKFCNLQFPETHSQLSFRSVHDTEQEFHGTVGGANPPSGKVSVHSEYGNVSLE